MFLPVGDLIVHVQLEGPASAPPLLLLHSLGTNLHLWDAQVPALARAHRVIRCDLRGHGLTAATPGDYTLDGLVADALAVLDTLDIRAAHVAGVSIGGRIAVGMAAAAPARVLSLLPIDTALGFGDPANWQQRIDAVRAGGMAAVADGVLARWVVDAAAPAAQGLRRMLLATDPAGYLGCAAALRDGNAEGLTGRVHCPATVIVGEADVSTPPDAARAVQAAIPGAELVVIPGAAHLPNFEQAEAVTATMLDHLSARRAAPGAEAGFAVRSRVLGADYVARTEAAVTPETAPFREFILDGVWGRIWTRPGLPHRDRSLLCLGMLAALGHEEELAIHIRATRNTGVAREEIVEVLLQVAAYAGVPAANAAFRVLKHICAEWDAA